MGICMGNKLTSVVPDSGVVQKLNSTNTRLFQDNMKFISKIPLFKQLPQSDVPRLAEQFITKKYKPAEIIVTEGDVGEDLYVIRSGEAKVFIMKDDSEKTEVAKLKAGDYFGESALVHNATRNATVEASTHLETLSISRERYDLLDIRKYIVFHRRLAVGAPKAEDEDTIIEDTEKDEDTTKLLKEAIKANRALNSVFDLSEGKILKLILAAVKENVAAGEDIIKEGDFFAEKFYIIESGNFDVRKETTEEIKHTIENQAARVHAGDEAKGTKVATLGPGNSFGEMALLYNAPRSSTVTASGEGVVWSIHRKKMQEILKDNQGRINELSDVIEKIPFFSSLLVDERKKMVNAMTELCFQEGETIIKQGDSGDSFFLLYEGTVKVLQDGEPVKDLAANKASAEFHTFGERALLENEPRNATVTAVSSSAVVFCLKRAVFDMVLGPLSAILEEAGKDGAMRKSKINTFYHKAAASKNMKKVLKSDLETVGLLGMGGFGTVSLEAHKTDGSVYALKAMSKGYICKLKMQSCVINEKAILMMTDSFFIIKLYACYNDTQSVYFLLEPCLGGELFETYNRQGLHGNANCALFYLGSVIEAFFHLHERHVIYRDLKPENCLLTKDGFCKLADMGLAKFVIGQTYTTCGTPDYFAPELLLGAGHNASVDWWTLGILLYELLDGVPPFDCPDVLLTYQKIKRGVSEIKFSTRKMSPTAISLMKDLLITDATRRLPCRPDGYKLLKEHAWFKDNKFDWDALQNQTLKPPFEPGFDEKQKLKNFSCHPEDLPPQIPYVPKMDTGWDKDFQEVF